MTSKIKLYPLGDFQSDTQIASLVDFSNDYWEFGGWEADAFGEDDTFPDKLALSHVLTDVNDRVLALLIASKQRERYLETALDDYLYIHKVLIHPDLRGKRIDNQSVFGFLFDIVETTGEDFGLYTQVLSVDSWNEHAINVYTHYEFDILAERSCGKFVMGRGFDY